MISLRDALQHIDARDYRDSNGTFSIQFMTCHRAKREGGQIITIEKAAKCGLPPNCKGHAMRGIKDSDTGKKTAVHNNLIFTLNGMEVFWI